MERRRFYFLEPSKTHSQHITLIRGYIAALKSSTLIAESFDLILCASKHTLAALPETLISGIRCVRVPVMNPEKRRLVRKTFVELFVVLRRLVYLRAGDVLFISCVLPTTLWLLEISNRWFRKTGVYVVLHGELEGLFDKSLQRYQSFGYWANKWMKGRSRESLLSLVVIDDFIRDKLVREFPDKLSAANVSVIHHPISPIYASLNDRDDQTHPSVCFVGYRTPFKGFEQFFRMASEHPSVGFLAIGGGKVENISSGTVRYLKDEPAYLAEISKCSAALFPCVSGYSCSLSAAALDALAAGVHIIALDRPCFRNLASYFGDDTITVHSSLREASLELGSYLLGLKSKGRVSRLESLSKSKYGLPAVQKSFEKLIFDS